MEYVEFERIAYYILVALIILFLIANHFGKNEKAEIVLLFIMGFVSIAWYIIGKIINGDLTYKGIAIIVLFFSFLFLTFRGISFLFRKKIISVKKISHKKKDEEKIAKFIWLIFIVLSYIFYMIVKNNDYIIECIKYKIF